MKASVDISYYPLEKEYKSIIGSFIRELQAHPELSIEVNGFSTQIFGEYDLVMKIITRHMKNAARERKGMFVLKVTGSHLQGPVDLSVV